MNTIKSKILVISIFLMSNMALYGYEMDDPTLGNIAIEAGIWQTELDGNIKNTVSETNFKDDLGFSEKKNITSFGLDLKNEYWWLPNVYINYFALKGSADGNITDPKLIDRPNDTIVTSTNGYDGSVSSSIEYSELNTILYGYLQQSIFQFDLGLNLKKIDYIQTIKENAVSSLPPAVLKADSFIALPYIGLKIDLYPINTVLKAEASVLAFGDDEAKDYKYSINYRAMKNMYISYGYRYHSWKTTNEKNVHEKYDMTLKGNYINAKILF